jgi:multidrug efflux pump subunit AcrA (membrane-fusion protein)
MKRVLVLVLLAMLMLSGCDAATSPSAPIPTVILDGGATAPGVPARAASGGVTASGVVVAAREATLGFGAGGNVVTVHVAPGDEVSAGQILVVLDDAAHQAAITQAEAALQVAQANYDLVAAGPTEAELRQVEALVEAAQARLDELIAGPRAEQVAQAEAQLASAQAGLALVRRGPTALELQQAQLVIEQAKGALWAAQSTRDAICGNKALADAQCDTAQAQVLVAETGVRQAENQLAQLQAGAAPEAVAQAREAVRIAEAQLALAKQPVSEHAIAAARAQVEQAQAQLDGLRAGAREQQLVAAQAQIASAEAQLGAVETQAGQLMLKAPFQGTVSRVSVASGEYVLPGQPVVALADLRDLCVETTDLSERDVPRVEIGQPVTVGIDALREEIPGRVSVVYPLPSTLGGDVVYRVRIALDVLPAGLRPGMSAQVRFQAAR